MLADRCGDGLHFILGKRLVFDDRILPHESGITGSAFVELVPVIDDERHANLDFRLGMAVVEPFPLASLHELFLGLTRLFEALE